jgi:membrane associated rhomboid family serine protease
MIGASAAVFGIVGAHVYTSICSKRHPSSMDAMEKLFWLTCISMELVGTPFTLDQVSLLFEDNIDHASHLCGFVGGFSLAFLWEHWHRKPDKANNQAIVTSL